MSENREEYTFLELATHSYNFTLSTLFESLMMLDEAFNKIGLTTCFCTGTSVKRLLNNDKPITILKNIICLDPIVEDEKVQA